MNPNNPHGARTGPPRRRIDAAENTPGKLVQDILKCKVPIYYNTGKAWNILGYNQQQKPTRADFVRDVDHLWDYLRPLKSRKARRAKVYILDALRVLGYRHPAWKVDRSVPYCEPFSSCVQL
jgi:hypothetical protein